MISEQRIRNRLDKILNYKNKNFDKLKQDPYGRESVETEILVLKWVLELHSSSRNELQIKENKINSGM